MRAGVSVRAKPLVCTRAWVGPPLGLQLCARSSQRVPHSISLKLRLRHTAANLTAGLHTSECVCVQAGRKLVEESAG